MQYDIRYTTCQFHVSVREAQWHYPLIFAFYSSYTHFHVSSNSTSLDSTEEIPRVEDAYVN